MKGFIFKGGEERKQKSFLELVIVPVLLILSQFEAMTLQLALQIGPEFLLY